MSAAADALVAAVLGRGARVTVEASGDGGAVSWRVTGPAGEPLVVKVAPAHAAPALSLTRSARAQRAAAAAGVPVPRVLDAGVRDGQQYLVSEHVAGRPWHEVAPTVPSDGRGRVLAGLADVLARLRTVTLPAHGDLDRPVLDALDALRARARSRIADPSRRAVAERVLDRHAHRFGAGETAVLVHGDLHHANVLVHRDGDGWVVVAVLDWDSAWAGPVDSDAARSALWDDMPGEPRPVDLRAAVHQLLWCLEYPADTPRHRADTARLAALLGVEDPSVSG
ncbi:phosphotransferase family protein [Cellulomonas sp. Marseille-Q8402]